MAKLTRIIISSCDPDGLKVRFDEDFIVNTWEEAFRLIIDVQKATGWKGDVKIEQAKFVLERNAIEKLWKH